MGKSNKYRRIHSYRSVKSKPPKIKDGISSQYQQRRKKAPVGRWILLGMVLATAYFIMVKRQEIMEKEAQPTKGAGETVRSVTDQADVKESTLPEQQEVTSTADIEKKYTDSIKEKTFLGFHYQLLLRRYFPAKNVRILGGYSIHSDTFRMLIGSIDTLSLFELNLPAIEKALESHPRVGDALLEKRYPHTLVVKIKDRREVASIIIAEKITGIDQDGIVLSDPIPGWTIDVPLISGVELAVNPGDTIHNLGVFQALEWIQCAKRLPRVDAWMIELVVSGDRVTRIEGLRNCYLHPGSHSINTQTAALDAFLSLREIESYQAKKINLEFPEFLIISPRNGV